MSEETNNEAVINITIEEDRVRYDTNLPVTDMVFWLEYVKKNVLEDVGPQNTA